MRGPVSFAQRIKSEICGNRSFCQRHRRALAYGLLLYGRSFTPESICLHTEHRRVARLYADSIADLAGLSGSITLREVRRQEGKSVYVATVDSLASYWSGQAAEETRSAYETFAGKFFQTYYDVLDQYVKFLRNNVAAQYEQTEQVNTRLSDAFK